MTNILKIFINFCFCIIFTENIINFHPDGLHNEKHIVCRVRFPALYCKIKAQTQHTY